MIVNTWIIVEPNGDRTYCAATPPTSYARKLGAKVYRLEAEVPEPVAVDGVLRAVAVEEKPPNPVFAASAMLAMVDGCPCWACQDKPALGLQNPVRMRMVVCPRCGNKRCPRAAHHDNACTNSNEPGQVATPACARCGGRGETDGHTEMKGAPAAGPRTCGDCGGTGKARPVSVAHCHDPKCQCREGVNAHG